LRFRYRATGSKGKWGCIGGNLIS
jgi:hypothetical protein